MHLLHSARLFAPDVSPTALLYDDPCFLKRLEKSARSFCSVALRVCSLVSLFLWFICFSCVSDGVLRGSSFFSRVLVVVVVVVVVVAYLALLCPIGFPVGQDT